VRKLEKAEIVQGIQEKVAKSRIGILTDFTGLKVEDMTRLRRQLHESAAELTVVKNTLLRRAATDESPISPLMPHFTGPNALALGYEDPVAVTKVLIKFAQEKPQLQIKAGVLRGQALSFKDLEVLSKLPAREVLLAQLLGVMQGVPQSLVTVLSGVIRNLLNVLVAMRDKKAETEAVAAPEAAVAPAAAVAAEPAAKSAEPEAKSAEPEARSAEPEVAAAPEAPAAAAAAEPEAKDAEPEPAGEAEKTESKPEGEA
jgi:large subunit ribosomal protein L10